MSRFEKLNQEEKQVRSIGGKRMNQELREKALTKMLEEMNGKHSGAIDKIHNFLCEQEDDVLFEGIMKEDRSINGSIRYAAKKARAASQDNCVVASDEDVYEWVTEYFKLDKEPDIYPVQARVETQMPIKKQTAEKKVEKPTHHVEQQVTGQISIFDF